MSRISVCNSGRYDARVRVILLDWAVRYFELTVQHFDMLEDAVVTDIMGTDKRPKTKE